MSTPPVVLEAKREGTFRLFEEELVRLFRGYHMIG